MNKYLLSILSIVPFIPSPIFAMDPYNDWRTSSHLAINLQKTNTLSKEQLQDLYRTGHLLSEESWYHVGEQSVDSWDPYYNFEMEGLHRLLNAMNSPNSVVGLRKQVESGDSFFHKKSITFHYNLSRDLDYPHYITLYPGTCYATFNLAQKLQKNNQANSR